MFDAPPVGVQSEDGTDRHHPSAHPSATAGERNRCLNGVQITDVEEKISDNLLFLSRKPLPIRWSAPPWPNGCGKGAVVMEGGAQEEVGEPA